jgi:serine phosphatase RsbU (regulator of sigma subunit)
MDIAIAIGNLSEIKDDARVIENDTTVLFDIDGYKEALKRFILTNNQTVFSDEDMKEIISRNTQTIEELLQEAGDFYTSHADFNRTPNPYDFLSSDLLKPKSLD